MKLLFLDFDGVISTFENHWKIDREKLSLLKKIIDNTDAKIIVTSSWKNGYKSVQDFITSLGRKDKNSDNDIFQWFLNSIHGIIPTLLGSRGEEVRRYMLDLDSPVESYVILDDDSDFEEDQLFNFVETDSYEGITEREVKLCITILNGKKVINPIRLNLVLTTMWRNNCTGLEKNNIKDLLEKYYRRFPYSYSL